MVTTPDLSQAESQIAKFIRNHAKGTMSLSELKNKIWECITCNYPEGCEPRGLPSFLLLELPPLHRIPRFHQRISMINLNLKFTKTGREIKVAAEHMCSQLKQRLSRRNDALEAFIEDREVLRSYLIRSSKATWGHGGFIWPKEAISSEKLEEVRQMCERIYDLEQDVQRLQMLITHLTDDQVFELTYDELVSYGFEPNTTA